MVISCDWINGVVAVTLAGSFLQTIDYIAPILPRAKVSRHGTGAEFQPFYGCETRPMAIYEFTLWLMGVGELCAVRPLFTRLFA